MNSGSNPSVQRTCEAREATPLIEAIQRERGLLEELKGGLERQRQAVANDDVEGIEQGVHAVHRVLFTLSEATARRRSLVGVLGGTEDSRLSELPALLEEDARPELEAAISELSESARVVQEALDLTRRVLRGAAEAGDTFIRSLLSTDTTEEGYPSDAGNRAGTLLNREV